MHMRRAPGPDTCGGDAERAPRRGGPARGSGGRPCEAAVAASTATAWPKGGGFVEPRKPRGVPSHKSQRTLSWAVPEPRQAATAKAIQHPAGGVHQRGGSVMADGAGGAGAVPARPNLTAAAAAAKAAAAVGGGR